ncbi:MAG: LPS-assembly protein LptD [Betaproteobacteria bacterium]|nr:LPS-assembly protein LptD [Betaproteobacteria bacterium]
MPSLSRFQILRLAPFSVLFAFGAAPAAAGAGYSVEVFRLAIGQAAVAAAAPGPTHIEALKIEGQQDVRVEATDKVKILRDAMRLDADEANYDLLTDEVDATGNVKLFRANDTITGPHLHLHVDEQVGTFDQPVFEIQRERTTGQSRRPIKGFGSADEMQLEGENRYILQNASFTTCEANDPAWYLKARELDLDYKRNDGSGTNATFHFQGIPMFYTPAISFPLTSERRSGFLAPTFGTSNVTGFDLTLPYYFNLAPNYDDTLAPRYLGRRGLQLNNEFRYLNSNYSGILRTEWLPEDQVVGKSRSAVSFVHQQNFGYGLTGRVNYNAVSDKDYFNDLSSRVTQTSTDTLFREGALGWTNGTWFSSSVLAQRLQTIAGTPQYNRLPQVSAQAYFPEVSGFSIKVPFDATYFQLGDADTGWRAYGYPQIQYNYVRPEGFITPKLGLHMTQYDLDQRVSAGPANASRVLPIASVDAGLFFERAMELGGKAFEQTLEPRLYYLNVPYRYQDNLPVFDTALADFNFGQIFSENIYSGVDRIANANQITAAVSSRLIDHETGAELLRGSFGTRYYFNEQRVTLPGQQLRVGQIADLLAEFSGQVLPSTTVDFFTQYNPRDSQIEQANIGLRYRPGFARVASLAYRYTRDQFTDVDVALQWPIYGGFYGVARVSGDARVDKLTQAIAGLEYNGGCWVFRAVANRLLNTSGLYTNAYYIQFEFGGVVSIGNSPVSLLERSVVGYGRINQPIADPVFGSQ